MHILIMTGAGLILLALSYFGPEHLFAQKSDAMRAFLWVWLAISIGNGLYGHFRAGIPAINEVGAFLPIFLIPAAIAFYLMRHGG
jgi:hypothetical protein